MTQKGATKPKSTKASQTSSVLRSQKSPTVGKRGKMKQPLTNKQIWSYFAGLVGLPILGFGIYFLRATPVSASLIQVAADLKKLEQAILDCKTKLGSYPANVPTGEVPAGMDEFASMFKEDTPIGGNYDWEGPDTWGYAAIAIQKPKMSIAKLLELDKKIDDGKLYTGKFRFIHDNYSWMIEENALPKS